MWTLDETCGKCYDDHNYNMHRNLMEIVVGKIDFANVEPIECSDQEIIQQQGNTNYNPILQLV